MSMAWKFLFNQVIFLLRSKCIFKKSPGKELARFFNLEGLPNETPPTLTRTRITSGHHSAERNEPYQPAKPHL